MRKLLLITSTLFVCANAVAQTTGINLSYIDSTVSPKMIYTNLQMVSG